MNLPPVRVAWEADIESLDSPTRDQPSGGGGGDSVSLPFQVRAVSAQGGTVALAVSKGRINGAALETDSLEVAEGFSGGIYLKVSAFGAPSFEALASAPADTKNEGYLRLATISQGDGGMEIENLRTTSFESKNCNSAWVFYAV